jgi:drug/metabolite transporter (DMT)-like permease
MTFAALLVAPFSLRALAAAWPRLDRRGRAALFVAGGCLALHLATWIASLSFTSVAVSVLLVNTAPLFSLGLSRLFLGEPLAASLIAATSLGLVGAGLIAYGDFRGDVGSLKGAALAVAGAATLAGYHVAGRSLRTALPLRAYLLGAWAASAAVLGILALVAATPLAVFPARTWLAFAGLAIVPTVFGHGLVNLSLRSLPAPTIGLFLLGEPLAAAALAALFLGELPSGWTLAGGSFVLAALALVILGERA